MSHGKLDADWALNRLFRLAQDVLPEYRDVEEAGFMRLVSDLEKGFRARDKRIKDLRADIAQLREVMAGQHREVKLCEAAYDALREVFDGKNEGDDTVEFVPSSITKGKSS